MMYMYVHVGALIGCVHFFKRETETKLLRFNSPRTTINYQREATCLLQSTYPIPTGQGLYERS